jgi:hypothetical protein
MANMNYNIKNELVSQLRKDRDESAQRAARQIAASLCANCKHQSDCVYLFKASGPIIECELHECGLSAKPRLVVVKKQLTPDMAEEPAADEPLGLCINCTNLPTCKLPKHEGGVWHCEECN